MALEHAILGFLDREPMTGYDLKTRCFDDSAGHVWTADQAQVYRTLEKLARSGLVRSRLVPQRGRPDRRLFTITAKGRSELTDWLRTPVQPPPTRDPFLLHLMLASELPDADIVSLLQRARVAYQERLDHLRGAARERLDAWELSTGRARDAELERITLAAGASQARSTIDWIDDSLERVGRGLPPRGPSDTEGGDGA